jgi:hypothetical protein
MTTAKHNVFDTLKKTRKENFVVHCKPTTFQLWKTVALEKQTLCPMVLKLLTPWAEGPAAWRGFSSSGISFP